MLASKLSHRTDNVASGRVTRNGEIAEAIMKAIPGRGQDSWLDPTRIRDDTGYQPRVQDRARDR